MDARPSFALVIFMRVSVVMMARAASSNRDASSPATKAGRALTIRVRSSSTPITPVEAGRISAGFALRAFAAAATHSVATDSPLRVAQFAFPALISRARTRPFEECRFLRATTTGAATTRFFVNTAAALAGESETISARSSLMVLRIPAYIVEYRNPLGRFIRASRLVQ